jgi:hypothetical protein
MKTPLTFFLLMVASVSFRDLGSARAEDKPRAHVSIPTIAARPEDVSSIEAIVKADYESISGEVGVPRQWARDLSLYDPSARSFSVYRDSKTADLKIWNPTLQEYADEADAHFVREGFVERELAHKIYRFGNVATVASSYEGKFTSTGKLYSQGVNIYQLYYADKRWWISSVSWDAEQDISPIPPELDPRTRQPMERQQK